MKPIALFTTIAVLVGGVTPVMGYDGDQKDKSKEYVPRSEYEQLKKMFEQEREDYQQLKNEVEALKQAQQKAPQTPHEQLAQMAEKPKEKTVGSKGLEILPPNEITPGWERARAPGWMTPSRLNTKSVRISKMNDMDLYMGLDTVGRFQALTQDNVADTVGTDSIPSRRLRPGFQTAFGNMSFLADFNKQMEVYFDIFLADKPHQNQLQGDEGYMLIRELPSPVGDNPWAKSIFDHINVKAGQFETDFGDSHYRRSINAAVQRNPLVGGYLIDPRATEIGMEVYTDDGALPIPVNAMVGFGSGTDTGDFRQGHQFSVHGKLWANPIEKLRTSASIYAVDHSHNSTSQSRTNLFRANRSGGSYSGIFDDGTSPGDITPGAGQKVLATQFDVTWEGNPLELYSHVGWVQDADTNGSTAGTPTESWLYYAAEGVWRFTDRFYAAARYSGAAADRLPSSADSSLDVDSKGLAHRFQVGLGYWLTKTVLFKAEYVYQMFNGFKSNGSQVSGVDAWDNPKFNGAISEVSFSF